MEQQKIEHEILSCGCEREFVNGRWMWYYCDEHDVESLQEITRPIKKFKKHIDEQGE